MLAQAHKLYIRILTIMNDLSLRPGLWINNTNSQVTIPLFDYK